VGDVPLHVLEQREIVELGADRPGRILSHPGGDARARCRERAADSEHARLRLGNLDMERAEGASHLAQWARQAAQHPAE
jgi:hypothetical protein